MNRIHNAVHQLLSVVRDEASGKLFSLPLGKDWRLLHNGTKHMYPLTEARDGEREMVAFFWPNTTRLVYRGVMAITIDSQSAYMLSLQHLYTHDLEQEVLALLDEVTQTRAAS